MKLFLCKCAYNHTIYIGNLSEFNVVDEKLRIESLSEKTYEDILSEVCICKYRTFTTF